MSLLGLRYRVLLHYYLTTERRGRWLERLEVWNRVATCLRLRASPVFLRGGGSGERGGGRGCGNEGFADRAAALAGRKEMGGKRWREEIGWWWEDGSSVYFVWIHVMLGYMLCLDT
jgi:hypothetical protein